MKLATVLEGRKFKTMAMASGRGLYSMSSQATERRVQGDEGSEQEEAQSCFTTNPQEKISPPCENAINGLLSGPSPLS